MNKECPADIFRLQDTIYLRCFADGTFVEITEESIAECPNCKRELFINHDYLYPKTRKMLQVYHPECHMWMDVAVDDAK